jgi:hypothetical protein
MPMAAHNGSKNEDQANSMFFSKPLEIICFFFTWFHNKLIILAISTARQGKLKIVRGNCGALPGGSKATPSGSFPPYSQGQHCGPEPQSEHQRANNDAVSSTRIEESSSLHR